MKLPRVAAGGSPQPEAPRRPAGAIPFARRALGFKLIVAYKLIRAPLMLAFAIWLSAERGSALGALGELARGLGELGAAGSHAGAWLEANVTGHILTWGAVLAWLDAASTAIEGLLLLSGRSWAEWIVVAELGCLLPLGAGYLAYRPDWVNLGLLAINALIVAYLARGCLRRRAGASGG